MRCVGGPILIGCMHLTILGGLLGCVDARVSQRLWHQQMAWTGACVHDGAREPDAAFSAAQLQVMAGKPDYVLEVKQFVDRAKQKNYTPEELRSQLSHEFTRSITIPLPDGGTRLLTDKDGHAVTLDDCQLWVYEENRRFPSPLPSCAGVPGHYYCYVFFVRGTVFGRTQFSRWQALEAGS